MKSMLLALARLLLAPVSAVAQTEPPKNPNTVIFTCSADHAQHTGHELDIVDQVTAATIATLPLGNGPLNADGDFQASINVQPIIFGFYIGYARAIGDGRSSVRSTPSNAFERAPGSPNKPRFADRSMPEATFVLRFDEHGVSVVGP